MARNPVIREILRQGRRQPRKYVKAALETGKVESNFTNLPGGDADSVNWRQERASIYGGDMSIRRSVQRFYREAAQHDAPGKPAWQVAADVQRPRADLRGRYLGARGTAEAILSGKRTGGGGGGAGRRTGGDAGTVRFGRPDLFNFTRQTTFDKAGFEQAERRSLVAQMLQRAGRGNSSLFRTGLLSTATPDPADFSGSRLVSSITQGSNSRLIPGRPGTVATGGGGAGVLMAKGRGRVHLAPGADRPGVPTNRQVIRFVRQVSALSGEPLTIGTGSHHSRLTTSGNVSDHWGGNAADIPASGSNLIRLGRAALVAAGMSPAQARKAKGGIYNVRGGQIIFNTTDHYDHLHVNPPDHLRRVRARRAGRRAEKKLTGR
jgi:hypothetical protein